MAVELTPEEKAKRIAMVRMMVGDTPTSPFYPIMTDEEIESILEMYNWNVIRAARTVAMGIAFQLSMVTYRERTADIEVWNNASLEYKKVLDGFINDTNGVNLPDHLVPYAAGISIRDVCQANANPDRNRSPLAKIRFCDEWWFSVPGFEKLCQGRCTPCGTC